MKVILTTKKEKNNTEQITNLLNLVLFDYNVTIEEKKKTNKNKVVSKRKKVIVEKQKETNKTIIEKNKETIVKKKERIKREREWLEDYYYSQSKNKEEIDKLVNYYSNIKIISNYY